MDSQVYTVSRKKSAAATGQWVNGHYLNGKQVVISEQLVSGPCSAMYEDWAWRSPSFAKKLGRKRRPKQLIIKLDNGQLNKDPITRYIL